MNLSGTYTTHTNGDEGYVNNWCQLKRLSKYKMDKQASEIMSVHALDIYRNHVYALKIIIVLYVLMCNLD